MRIARVFGRERYEKYPRVIVVERVAQELGNPWEFSILGLQVSNNRFNRKGGGEGRGTEWWRERNLESCRAVNKRYVNQDNDPAVMQATRNGLRRRDTNAIRNYGRGLLSRQLILRGYAALRLNVLYPMYTVSKLIREKRRWTFLVEIFGGKNTWWGRDGGISNRECDLMDLSANAINQ